MKKLYLDIDGVLIDQERARIVVKKGLKHSPKSIISATKVSG